MPSVNRMSTPVAIDLPEIEGRYAPLDSYTEAGDAYYAPPGHLPLITAGTTLVEFSATAELDATMAVVEKNLAGMRASA